MIRVEVSVLLAQAEGEQSAGPFDAGEERQSTGPAPPRGHTPTDQGV